MSARRGLAWLALASFLSPSTLPLLVAAWLIAHHADAHAHSVWVEADSDHFDLVLAHDDAEPHEHDDDPGHGHGQAEPRHAGDHVVHFGGALDTTSRRLAPDDAPLPSHELPAATARPPRAPVFAVAPSPGRDTLLLRTIVLRL